MADRTIMEAKEPFAVYLTDGTPFNVGAGDRFWSDDPIVTTRARLFGEITVRSSLPAQQQKPSQPSTSGDVETASAPPGSRRGVTRPKSKEVPDA